jgi:hypothetical protein
MSPPAVKVVCLAVSEGGGLIFVSQSENYLSLDLLVKELKIWHNIISYGMAIRPDQDQTCTGAPIHCKKRLAVFPYPDGMSLTKFSLAGNY